MMIEIRVGLEIKIRSLKFGDRELGIGIRDLDWGPGIGIRDWGLGVRD